MAKLRRAWLSLLLALSCGQPACLGSRAARTADELLTIRREALAPDLVLLRGGGGNTLVLVRRGHALIVDGKGWPFAEAVVREVERQGAVTDVVISTTSCLRIAVS